MTNIAFFVTGHGRSGTQWLARLLNADPALDVRHEPLRKMDTVSYGNLRGDNAVAYLKARRARMIPAEGLGWGEVNSYLRYWAPQLHEAFPGVPVVGLVRDGRYVVRSMMARGVFSRGRPVPGAPVGGASKFERACRYWASTYRLLTSQDVPMFKLERLNEDRDYFAELCREIGAHVSQAIWRRFAGRRIHVLVKDTGPPRWTPEQVETFLSYAGDMQEYFGYETDKETRAAV